MASTSTTIGALTVVLLLAPLLAAAPPVIAQGGFQPTYEVSLEKEHAEADPQSSATFPIVIENLGDQRVRFTFERVDEDQTRGVQAAVPAPIELDSPGPGSTSTATVNLQVYTPFRNGYLDEDDEVTLRVIPQDPEDPSRQGEPTTLTVSVHTEGFHIPGPGVWTVLAVLAGVAGTRGLRRSSQGRNPPNRTRSFRSRQGDW